MPVPIIPNPSTRLTNPDGTIERTYRSLIDFLWRRWRGDALDRAIIYCTGSPNGQVTGSVGDLAIRTDGGAGSTLYVKESGTATNTGWAAK